MTGSRSYVSRHQQTHARPGPRRSRCDARETGAETGRPARLLGRYCTSDQMFTIGTPSRQAFVRRDARRREPVRTLLPVASRVSSMPPSRRWGEPSDARRSRRHTRRAMRRTRLHGRCPSGHVETGGVELQLGRRADRNAGPQRGAVERFAASSWFDRYDLDADVGRNVVLAVPAGRSQSAASDV